MILLRGRWTPVHILPGVSEETRIIILQENQWQVAVPQGLISPQALLCFIQLLSVNWLNYFTDIP